MEPHESLQDLQAEGRRRLRQVAAARSRVLQERSSSEETRRQRRAERSRQVQASVRQILIQAAGTTAGGGMLALAGLAVGLIQSTPTAQLFSIIAVIAGGIAGLATGVMTGRTAAKANRQSQEQQSEIEYLRQVAQISSDHKLGEDP